ncbi:MAG TPA: hypothetical protein VK548_21900 [Candidatus Acidoferrum sp.]|nr:hypothetical protein [Candidatus Acidoferrum sp.]
MLTRRRFTYTLMGLAMLRSGRSTCANAADSNVSANGVSLEGPLTRDVFLALVGQEFSLLLTNRPAILVLLRVDDGGRPDGSQFTVVFRGASDLKVVNVLEGTYRITHSTAGTTELYLRPKGGDDRYVYFEAPFNVTPDNAGIPPPVREPRRFERPLYEPERPRR